MFTSASTLVLKTFACDDEVLDGQSFLRADYSISCGTNLHMFFRVYAGLLLLVSRLTTRESGRGHLSYLLFWL